MERIKRMKRDMELKEERILALEESRNNTLESCKILNQEQKKRIEALEKGAKQIDDMCNSILVYLAKQNGGELRIPQDKIMIDGDTTEYSVTKDAMRHEYVLTIRGNKE